MKESERFSKTFFNAVTVLTETIADATTQATKEAIQTSNRVATVTAKGTHDFLEKTTEQTGRAIESLEENPLVKLVSKFPGADWLMSIIGKVDVEKVKINVDRLKRQYPQETNTQIAHRLIVEKAWQAGRLGLVANIIPPVAAALFGIELVATAKLQAEMVYEIAAAYDLDLQDSTRRGEVLGIFGLSLSRNALKTGLSFAEILPGVGAVVGASTNALMLYTLGATASRFYEEKSKHKNSGDRVGQFNSTQPKNIDID
ncbi:MAG: hypothetical protein ACRC11_01135 [Xenococcaceae cyanobacterium]